MKVSHLPGPREESNAPRFWSLRSELFRHAPFKTLSSGGQSCG